MLQCYHVAQSVVRDTGNATLVLMATVVDNEEESGADMRPLIAKALAVCVAVAIAPWLTGGQDPLAMLISGFALLIGMVLVKLQPVAPQLRSRPLGVLYWALVGFAALSLLWSANRYSSALWITQWVMLGLTFYLSWTASQTLVGRKWLIGAYLASAAAFSLAGIGLYLTSEYGRLTGTFYWANPAAAYLIPAILLGMDGLRRATGRRAAAGWMAFTVVGGSAFWLTDSRAASAVLAVVVIIYVALSKLSWRTWVNYVFTLMLAVGLGFALVKLGTITVQHGAKILPGSRYSEALKGESSSGSDRLFYLRSAAEMWLKAPLGGQGAGTYGDVHPQYQERVVSAATNAHNVYAQTWAELGLVGGLLLLMLMGVVLFGALRGLVERPELFPVALGLLGLLMHFGLDIDARYPALLGLVGALLGLMYAAKSVKWVKLGIIWPLVAILALLPVISLYQSETWAMRGRAAQTDEAYDLAMEDFELAHSWPVANPDYLGADGINRFVLAGADQARYLDEALALARRAQRADPHDAQHYQLEGRILARKGDFPGAEKALRRALTLDSFNHPDYALDLASVLTSEKQPEAALAVAGAMLKQYPADVVNNRATDESIKPQLADLEALVGNIYLQTGRLSEAKAAAARAIKLNPKGLRGRALSHQLAPQP
jgi:O-antigen ligase/cytochrome c-type biogenesis protein CcmH/NrfG